MTTEATVSRRSGYSRASVMATLNARRFSAALREDGRLGFRASDREDVQDGEPGVVSYGLRAPSSAVPVGAEVSI